jgi:hypothetical protein
MASDLSSKSNRDPATVTYWRLLALGLDPDKTEPDLYGLIYEGETDVPLMVNGRIVFFTDPARALELIRQYGAALIADEIDVAKPFIWCDVAQALYFLSSGGMDTEDSVLEAVNVLLDLVKASGARLEERRKRALYAIADYCTFNKDLTKYLEEEGDYSSAELVDAVLWCVGAVTVKARIL